MTDRVGYQKTLLDYSLWPEPRPVEYEAARLRNGRVTERRVFATEAEADEWIDNQRDLDKDDRYRSTGRWTAE